MTAELRSQPVAPVRPQGTTRPRRPFEAWKWVSLGVWAVLVVWSIRGLDVKWSRLLDAPQDLYRLFELMFTQLEWSDLGRCVRAMWDSIAMVVGHLLFAPSSPCPWGSSPPRTSCPAGSRSCCDSCSTCCAVPELILVLALIPMLGLTESAGIMAIAIGSIGTLGKLTRRSSKGSTAGRSRPPTR